MFLCMNMNVYKDIVYAEIKTHSFCLIHLGSATINTLHSLEDQEQILVSISVK